MKRFENHQVIQQLVDSFMQPYITGDPVLSQYFKLKSGIFQNLEKNEKKNNLPETKSAISTP